ncbi:MAG TPA: hypothetical protein VLO30_10465 [Chthoniobacterales bacterium]|nr:hypothetical protein [Chthoniobacterales bacterium]
MGIKRNGPQPSSKGSPDWFTGTVRIDPLFEAPEPARVRGAGDGPCEPVSGFVGWTAMEMIRPVTGFGIVPVLPAGSHAERIGALAVKFMFGTLIRAFLVASS